MKIQKKKVAFIAVVVLFIGFLLVHFIPKQQEEDLKQKYEEDLKQKYEEELNTKRIEILNQAKVDFDKKNQETFDDFSAEIEAEINKKLDIVKKNIPSIVDDFSNILFCTKLVYKQAKDIIKKSDDTSQAIYEVLSDRYTKHLIEVQTNANVKLKAYNLSLEANWNNYQTSLFTGFEEINKTYTNDVSGVDINDTFIDVYNLSSEMSTNTSGMLVGLVIDTITIKSTIVLIKKICAMSVAKVCNSVGAATITAVADGPLPIGDIVSAGILVVSAVWTCYDIYKITNVLPKEMEKSLIDGVENLRKELITNIKKESEAFLKVYNEKGLQFHEKLSVEIGVTNK